MPTAGSLRFIGTATTLLRLGPFTLLTDPNFLHRGQHAYLGYGLTSRRRTEPAMSVAELPPLDAVVLSHLHGDHWDRVARQQLPRSLPILTTPHAAGRLRRYGRFRNALGLDTWRDATLTRDGMTLRVTALPGRHAPRPVTRLLPPVMGSMLELTSAEGHVTFRLYISGDTLLFDGLRGIRTHYPDIGLAVLHLGGTRLPGGLMVTMDAAQGADLLELLRPARAVPIHFDDYPVFKSPLGDFRREVERRGLAGLVTYVDRGETVELGAGA